jgi:hypothetical protein
LKEREMRKIIIGIIVVMMSMGMGTAFADKPDDGTTGNGAPQVKKIFSFNIIGVSKDKDVDMDNSGHRIFVPLEGKAQINLVEGEEFAVLDANGTDRDGALLQLPKPGLDPYLVGGDMTDVDTISDYSVFIRPLGKPGGWATITTCADLVDSNFAGLLPGKFERTLNNTCYDFDGDGVGDGLASVEQVGSEITLRTKGKSTFKNVTAELLTIVFKVEVEVEIADGEFEIQTVYVRVPIFDDIIENEYWEYDNHGLKILQVRFYEIGTDVSLGDDPAAWDALPQD